MNRLPFRIKRMRGSDHDAVAAFIASWSSDDVYLRFGTYGVASVERYLQELLRSQRAALLMSDGESCVAVLDYVEVNGEFHIGVFVAKRLRRRHLASSLLKILLARVRSCERVLASCSGENRAAVALLRSCGFASTSIHRGDMEWSFMA